MNRSKTAVFLPRSILPCRLSIKEARSCLSFDRSLWDTKRTVRGNTDFESRPFNGDRSVVRKSHLGRGPSNHEESGYSISGRRSGSEGTRSIHNVNPYNVLVNTDNLNEVILNQCYSRTKANPAKDSTDVAARIRRGTSPSPVSANESTNLSNGHKLLDEDQMYPAADDDVRFEVTSDSRYAGNSLELSSRDLEAVMQLARGNVLPRITSPVIAYVSHEPTTIDRIIHTFRAHRKKFVGIDTEFITSSVTRQHQLRLMQIAIDDLIVLIILTKHMNREDLDLHMPHLKELLTNSSILKVGVGSVNDCNRINSHFDLRNGGAQGTELKLSNPYPSPSAMSLKHMSCYMLDTHLNKDMKTPREWDSFPHISLPSVIYAATDAQISLLVYKALTNNHGTDMVPKCVSRDMSEQPHVVPIAKTSSPDHAFDRLSIALEARL